MGDTSIKCHEGSLESVGSIKIWCKGGFWDEHEEWIEFLKAGERIREFWREWALKIYIKQKFKNVEHVWGEISSWFGAESRFKTRYRFIEEFVFSG